MTTFQRYMLFQIPGWVLAVIVLFVLRGWLGLPLWVSFLLFALYVAKDFALYPFLQVGYEPSPRIGAEQLIGEVATVKTPLAPDGFVRVRGELWRARLAAGSAPVEVGSRVRVAAARGMILTVGAEPDDGPSSSPYSASPQSGPMAHNVGSPKNRLHPFRKRFGITKKEDR